VKTRRPERPSAETSLELRLPLAAPLLLSGRNHPAARMELPPRRDERDRERLLRSQGFAFFEVEAHAVDRGDVVLFPDDAEAPAAVEVGLEPVRASSPSPKKTSHQDILHVAASVDDRVDEHQVAFHAINDAPW